MMNVNDTLVAPIFPSSPALENSGKDAKSVSNFFKRRMSRRQGLVRAIQGAWKARTARSMGSLGCSGPVPSFPADKAKDRRVVTRANVAAGFRGFWRAFGGSFRAADRPGGGASVSGGGTREDDASRRRAGKDMMIVYTCAKCSTRSGKSFSKQAYTKGVVIVTCPGCDAKHLIADNLGWFGDETNVEALLGERVDKAEVGLTEDGTLTLMETTSAREK